MDIAQLQQRAAEYLEQGQYSDAIDFYQRCIDINPTLRANYWHLGLALLLQGEELEAQAVWLTALAQETDVCLGELLKVLEAEAIRHLQSGNMQLAERIYWQIIELDSNQAEAYYRQLSLNLTSLMPTKARDVSFRSKASWMKRSLVSKRQFS